MAGVFRKAMVWLGLAPDEDYDDYGYEEPMRPVPGQPRPPVGYGGAAPMTPGMGAPGRPVRPTPRGPGDSDDAMAMRPRPAPRPSGAVRQLPGRGVEPGTRREETPTVRPMRPTSAKPAVIAPESFDDAKSIADRFKAEQPVVMDLAAIDRDLARRLIDFASGICYGLGGDMERVSPGRYLLTPSGVEVSAEERRRLRSGR